MPEEFSCRFAPAHGPEWSRLAGVQLGPPSPGTPWLYLLVCRGQRPWLRLYLELQDGDCDCFQEALVWQSALWVGFGSRVFRLALEDMRLREFPLDCYFGSFFPLQRWLLVCSASRLLCLDGSGEQIWRSPELGVDGVLVQDVSGQVIEGQGEWDPPGGWRDFRLDLKTGVLL